MHACILCMCVYVIDACVSSLYVCMCNRCMHVFFVCVCMCNRCMRVFFVCVCVIDACVYSLKNQWDQEFISIGINWYMFSFSLILYFPLLAINSLRGFLLGGTLLRIECRVSGSRQVLCHGATTLTEYPFHVNRRHQLRWGFRDFFIDVVLS